MLPGPHGQGRYGLRLTGIQCAVSGGKPEDYATGSVFTFFGHSSELLYKLQLGVRQTGSSSQCLFARHYVANVYTNLGYCSQIEGIGAPVSALVATLGVPVNTSHLSEVFLLVAEP